MLKKFLEVFQKLCLSLWYGKIINVGSNCCNTRCVIYINRENKWSSQDYELVGIQTPINYFFGCLDSYGYGLFWDY